MGSDFLLKIFSKNFLKVQKHHFFALTIFKLTAYHVNNIVKIT